MESWAKLPFRSRVLQLHRGSLTSVEEPADLDCYSSFWAMYVFVSGTYQRVVSRKRCQKSWNAERSRDSTSIIPLYVVPQIWAYSETIATSFGIFFLNSSHPVAAFFLSASVSGLTRKKIRNANIKDTSPSSDPSWSGLIWLSEIRR